MTRILAKKSPSHTVPSPSPEEWKVLCEYLGIRSCADLRRTLGQAGLGTRIGDAALSIFSPYRGERNSLVKPLEDKRATDPTSWDSPGPEEIDAALAESGIQFPKEDEVADEVNSLSDPIHIRRAQLRKDPHLRALVRWRGSERRRLRLDRKARWLALRKPVGDLHGPVPPPNTLEELGAVLPGLIELDPSVLSQWHVQRLLSQLVSWHTEGADEEKEAAKTVSERIGKAFVLSLKRGPKGDEKRRREEAKRIAVVYGKVWKDLNEAWLKDSASERYQFMTDRWGEDHVPVMGDPYYGERKAPKEVARDITRSYCKIASEGDLKRKLFLGKRLLREEAKPINSGS